MLKWRAPFLSLVIFLPIAVASTLVAAVAYTNEQQILRLGANEPQEWLAQDAASRIANGESVPQVAMGTPVAIESSPAPYVIVYDASGKPIAGTGYLQGNMPTLPKGVFDSAFAANGDFITWEPEAHIRQAIVVDPIHTAAGGFVVSGRSLAYTEQEEDTLLTRTIFGLVITLVVTFVTCLFITIFFHRHRAPHKLTKF
jgi:hypothetical protein